MSDIRNYEEYRRQVLDSLGEDYTVEDLRNFERWRLKVLHGLGGGGKVAQAIGVTNSASGSIASFDDGGDDLPMKSLKVEIVPKQSGSGDPAPDNVRPISGWSGVNVGQSGKNMFEVADINDDNWNGSVAYTITHLQLTKETNGVSIVTYGGESTQQWVLRKLNLKPNTTYSFRYVSSVGHERIFIRLFDNDGNNISSASIPISGFAYNQWFSTYFKNGEQATFTIPSNCSYAWVGFGVASQATNAKVYFTDIQLELGSTATDYEPYQGESKYIPFKDENGDPITVHGGDMDVVSGKLKSYPFYSSYNGETLSGEWICDRAVYSEGTTPPIGSQVVDMSGNGTEYNLDPTEIRTLKGVNNVWAGTGDVEDVQYIADTKTYIDNKVAELQALVLENIGG